MASAQKALADYDVGLRTGSRFSCGIRHQHIRGVGCSVGRGRSVSHFRLGVWLLFLLRSLSALQAFVLFDSRQVAFSLVYQKLPALWLPKTVTYDVVA